MSFHLAMSFSWMELNWSGLEETRLCGMSFEPVPLDDGGFEERGGGVGVVLEELGGGAALRACPCDVEAAVEGGGLVVPGPLDGFDGEGGDVEFGVTFFVDDVLGGGEAHLLELCSRRLRGCRSRRR